MTAPAEGLPGAPGEVRDALRRTLLVLADSKRILGIRYSDWLLGAPSIEAAIAASSMAQDEWGHARLLYAALRDFGADPEELEQRRPADAYASCDALDPPFRDWAEFIAGATVVDGALSVLLEAVGEGYPPLAGRVGKMLAEEAFHRALAEAWFRRLAGGSPAAEERLRAGLDRVLPGALRCAAPGDGPHRILAEAGVLAPEGELRSRIRDRLAPLLGEAGVRWPADPEPGLPAGWDAARGRGPGRPDDDAVERARGDRNRAFLVE